MNQAKAREIHVGVVSDTHGLLRPEVMAALAGSDLIVHAGDIGEASVIRRLESIAPVHAVRGNVDHAEWAYQLPEKLPLQVGASRLYVLHDIGRLEMDPVAGGFAAVVYGHSHIPRSEVRGAVLYFNPGSAGPRRFHLPVSVGRLVVHSRGVTGELMTLEA